MPRDITVTFDDGSTHVYRNAPDDVSPSQVTQRAQKDFEKSVTSLDGGRAAKPEVADQAITQASRPQRELGLGEAALEAIPNIPGSAANLLGGVYQAVTSPVETLSTLGKAATGAGLRALSPEAGRNPYAEAIRNLFSPEYRQQAQDISGAVGQAYKSRYGGYPEIKRTLAEDPVGLLADLSLLGTGVGGLGAKAAGAANLPRVAGAAQGVQQVAQAVDPLSLMAKAAAKPTGAAITGAVNLLDPNRRAASLLQKALPDVDIPQMLTQTRGMPTTPGYVPTMAERAAEAGALTPQLGALQTDLASAGEKQAQGVYAAKQRQEAALGRQAERGRMKASIEAERSAAGIPDPGLATAGKTLQERADKLAEDFRKKEITPKYQAAFEAAADAPIDVSPIVTEAESILGQPLTAFKGETAPETAKILRQFQERVEQPAVAFMDIKKPVAAGEVIAPTATLEELDGLRKAVNADIASAEAGTSPLSPTTLGNLKKLHKAIDEAVQTSDTLSDVAKTKYADALKTYREEFVPRFKTDLQGKIRRKTLANVRALDAPDAVKAFMADEGSIKQFTDMYGRDPAALEAMRNGISRLYRDQVFDPKTGMIKEGAHEVFMDKYRKQFQELKKSGLDMEADIGKTSGTAQMFAGISKEAEKIAAMAPKDFNRMVQLDLRRAKPQDLTNMQLIADDLRRAKQVESAAIQAKGTAPEVPGKIVAEGEVSIARPKVANENLIRGAINEISRFFGKASATRLVYWMYQNPDAARRSLQNLKSKIEIKPEDVAGIKPAIQAGYVASRVLQTPTIEEQAQRARRESQKRPD